MALRPSQTFEKISDFLSESFTVDTQTAVLYSLLRFGSQHRIPKPLFFLGFLGIYRRFLVFIARAQNFS